MHTLFRNHPIALPTDAEPIAGGVLSWYAAQGDPAAMIVQQMNTRWSSFADYEQLEKAFGYAAKHHLANNKYKQDSPYSRYYQSLPVYKPVTFGQFLDAATKYGLLFQEQGQFKLANDDALAGGTTTPAAN